jgi:GNAT superfamily N-acetyltransferase
MEPQLIELITPDAAILNRIGKLRVKAWETEVPAIAELDSWLDGHDPFARHWAFVQDDELIAAARLTIHERLADVPDADDFAGVTAALPTPLGVLSRLVVAPHFRRLGLSKRLDAVRIGAAEQAGCQAALVASSSGGHRIAQLQAFGFEVIAERRRSPLNALELIPRPGLVLMCRLPRPKRALQSEGAIP